MAAHPWLQSFLGDQEKVASKTTRGGVGGAGQGDHGGIDVGEGAKDEVELDHDAVFTLLYQKRALLDLEAPKTSPQFSVVLLGGSWTAKHLHVAFDALKGRAANSEVETWCVRFGFQKSMRFSLLAYGEATAQVLANSWCLAMQHWWDLSIESTAAQFVSREAPCWIPSDELERIRGEARGPLLARCQQILDMRPIGG